MIHDAVYSRFLFKIGIKLPSLTNDIFEIKKYPCEKIPSGVFLSFQNGVEARKVKYALTELLRLSFFGCNQIAGDQKFGNLHRIKRCTFAQIIGNNPERQAIFNRDILADTADKGVVFSG